MSIQIEVDMSESVAIVGMTQIQICERHEAINELSVNFGQCQTNVIINNFQLYF